jgi:tetratricopeptide (TPR) repeat protein
MRALKAWALLALAPLSLRAQTNYSAASAAASLQGAGGSARAVAMGGAFVGLADDAGALYYNPAGLAGIKGHEISLNHNSWLLDINQEQLSAAFSFGRGGGLGLSLNYLNFGTFEGRDAAGNLTQGYTGNRIGGGIAWGISLGGGLSAGAGFNAFGQSLADAGYKSSSADLGALWEPLPGTRLGVAYLNYGHSVGGGATAAPLRLGASQRLGKPKSLSVLLAASGALEAAGVNRLQLGAEASYGSLAAARVGYQLDLGTTVLDGLTGLSAGGGFEVGHVSLDYAWLPFGDLGSSQRLSMSYLFGQPAEAAPREAAVAPRPAGGEDANALKLKFRLPSEHATRAKELEAQGDVNGALAEMQLAIKENAQDSAAWRQLGGIYQRAGKKAYAVQCYEQVQRLAPEPAFATWLEAYRAR